jgi:hypothetical protein
MTQEHPITPQPELVQQWVDTYFGGRISQSNFHVDLATQAAQWGADQELEACCEWFQEFYKTESWVKHDLKHFRDARRPKPPSLKEQALEALDEEQAELSIQNYKLIRAVLESLSD